MRTTFDLPDELMRHLKARAAMEGRSLRDLTLELLERGLRAPAVAPVAAPPLPTLRLGAKLASKHLSHAALSELAEE
ncbi:MAG TPA: hypothetical protein VGM81_18910 [Burkholderiaceae bacterium]|jgi:plasmid stability protein